MIIIALRTDKPEAEIGIYEDKTERSYLGWEAHRKLAETIHTTLESELSKQQLNLRDIGGIVCYKGPGSFTGLRIGLTVANALAYSLNIPVVAEHGGNWQQDGIDRLLHGENEKISMPEYGAPATTTQPRK
jgi:tRNA threonylcarbamoyladenosine biosynthesis protein TsaB